MQLLYDVARAYLDRKRLQDVRDALLHQPGKVAMAGKGRGRKGNYNTGGGCGAAAAAKAPTSAAPPPGDKSKEAWKLCAAWKCRFGDRCRFTHIYPDGGACVAAS